MKVDLSNLRLLAVLSATASLAGCDGKAKISPEAAKQDLHLNAPGAVTPPAPPAIQAKPVEHPALSKKAGEKSCGGANGCSK